MRTAALLCLLGCGRIGFSSVDETDASIDAPLTSCSMEFISIGCQEGSGPVTNEPVFISDTDANDLIVFALDFNGTTSGVTSIVSDAGDAFVAAGPIARSVSQSAVIYYAIASATTSEITVTFDTATDGVGIHAATYRGIDSLDPLVAYSMSGGDSNAPTVSITPDGVGQTVVAHAVSPQDNTPTTGRNRGTCNGNSTQDVVAVSTARLDLSFSSSTVAPWAAVAAAFKPNCL